MTADEAVDVVRVVVAELIAAGARIDPSELAGLQRRIAAALWPALDEPSRRQVAAEGREWAIASGRAVMVMDEDGRQSYWHGEET
jgi:hypothetical protein